MKSKEMPGNKNAKTDKIKKNADRPAIPMRPTPVTAEAPAEPATVLDQATISDQARDNILRHQLAHGRARSAADRHRERLTATEDESVPDNDDEAKSLDELLKKSGVFKPE